MFVRHVGVAAVAGVAAFSAGVGATVPSPYPPPPTMSINDPTNAAYTYSNEPFQCIQPTVNLNVNETHVIILMTSYSQQADDTRTTTAPAGRTQFAFGTFLSNIAYPTHPFWDPAATTAVTTADMFTTTYLSSTVDSYLNMGSCGLGTNVGSSTYTTVNSLTVAPTLTGTENVAGGVSTSALTGKTSQAANCDCATYAIVDGGDTVLDLTLMDSMASNDQYNCPTKFEDTTTNHIFYSKSGNTFNGRASATLAHQKGITQSEKTNSWSYRQTTCGASADDNCDAVTDAGVYPFTGAGITSGTGDGSTSTCSIKTEALMIMPVEQFIIVMTDNNAIETNSAAGGSSTLQYTWEDYVIEYASTADKDAPNGVDVFQTRVTPARFKLNLYPAGAVVQSLGVGDIAPPMLLHTVATGNTGPVAWAQRTGDNEMQMTWQLDAFVQQSNRDPLSTGYDTIFKSTSADAGGTGMRVAEDATNLPELVFRGPNKDSYSSTCDAWLSTQNELTDQSTLTLTSDVPAKTTSGYGCAVAECAPVGKDTLPSDLLAGLTDAAVARAQNWVQYHVTVMCTITRVDASYALSDDFVIPATTIRMKYRLQDANGNELTDMTTPPFSDIVQVGYTSPGTLSKDIKFNLMAEMIQLKENDIKTAADLTDLIYTSEDNDPLPNQLVYSEAMAVKVQIDDVISESNGGIALPSTRPAGVPAAIGNIRNAWQLQPTLMLMVAHDINAPGYDATAFQTATTQLDATTNQLQTSWCGLDQTQAIQAVWAVQDNRVAGRDTSGTYLAGYASTADTLTKLGPVYNNIVDVLSDDLKTTLSGYVQNNAFTGIADLQFDILNGVPGTAFTTAMSEAGASYSKVAIVPDATGGFAFPLRNRFFINGKASGYQLSFCTIAQAMPYLPVAVGGCASKASCNAFYPAYTTYAAALADTMSVGGTVFEPVTVEPTNVAGGAWIKYYIPSKPASTGGTVCIPSAEGSNSALAGQFDGKGDVYDPHASDNCVTLIQAAVALSQAASGAGSVACTGSNAGLLVDPTNADDGQCVCDVGFKETEGQALTNPGGNYLSATGSCTVADSAPSAGRRMLAVKPFSHLLRPKVQASVFSMSLRANRTIPALSTIKDLTTIIMPKTFENPAAAPSPALGAPPPTIQSQGATVSPPSPPMAPPSPPPSPSPPGTPLAKLVASDEQMLIQDLSLSKDTNDKVTHINKKEYQVILGVSVGALIAGACSLLAIIGFCITRSTGMGSGMFNSKKNDVQVTETGQVGPEFRNTGTLRTFGSGAAKMQWRAY